METAYPLFSISIPVILIYALSAVFVSFGLLSGSNHRKIWNVLLLIAFLVTGVIGLLMVIKLNYKLAVPFSEKILVYHVDFGIGIPQSLFPD